MCVCACVRVCVCVHIRLWKREKAGGRALPSAVNDRRHRLETFQNIKASRRVGEPFPARERVALGPYWKVHAHLSARAQLEQPEIAQREA